MPLECMIMKFRPILSGLLALGALTFAACSSSPVDEVANWEKAACACKDMDCHDAQKEKFKALESKFEGDKEPSKEDMGKIVASIMKGQACLEAVMSDPDS